MPRPWRRLKKLCHPRGGSPRGTPAGHTARGVVPRRDAGRAEEQAHLPLGPERLASPGHPRSTHPIDLSVRCGMPRTWNRRRPRAARLQHRSHAASSRRDRHQGRPWCPRDCHPRSSRLARRQGPRGAAQHLAPAAAAARARAKQPRKYLAVHAPELAVEPHLQILRRHRRSLLLRLEHPHRSALENHVHRLPRLGDRRSLFVRVGISGPNKAGETPSAALVMTSRTPPEALNPQKGNIMSIIRHEIRKISDENRGQPIISQAVVHGNVGYFAGITPNPIVGDIKTQTAQVLRRVDELLNLAGTDKSQLLSAQVWIADMRLFEDHNSVWNDWVDPANPPARACLTTGFWRPGMLVEVMVVAAVP